MQRTPRADRCVPVVSWTKYSHRLSKRIDRVAKHYYNIEVVTAVPLDEEEISELEELIKRYTGDYWSRVSTEYVDSEG